MKYQMLHLTLELRFHRIRWGAYKGIYNYNQSDVFDDGWYIPSGSIGEETVKAIHIFDITLRKQFNINSKTIVLYGLVENVTNSKYPLYVTFVSTTDDSNGWPSTFNSQFSDFVEYYNTALRDPSSFGSPRTVKLGMNIEL